MSITMNFRLSAEKPDFFRRWMQYSVSSFSSSAAAGLLENVAKLNCSFLRRCHIIYSFLYA